MNKARLIQNYVKIFILLYVNYTARYLKKIKIFIKFLRRKFNS